MCLLPTDQTTVQFRTASNGSLAEEPIKSRQSSTWFPNLVGPPGPQGPMGPKGQFSAYFKNV